MRARELVALAAGAVAVSLVAAFAPLFRPGGVVSSAVATGAVVLTAAWPPDRRRVLDWPLGIPAVVSLAATAAVLMKGEVTPLPGPGTPVEVAALLLLLMFVTRRNVGWSLPVVATLTATAQVVWLVRFMSGAPWWQQLLSCAFWGLGSAVAVAFGAYPRWASDRLDDSVAAAREAQQRQLERDLHDYVAHDLSGMIVQAQAARFAAAGDPAALAAALERIEEAGHRAMSSMDRALSILRAHGRGHDGPLARHPGLEELGDLLERFADGASHRVDLEVEGSPATVPGEVGEVLYRAASESLTNIRRHASPDLEMVAVTLRIQPRSATLVVEDAAADPVGPATTRTDGGTGLAELRQRVEALGGVLDTGATTTGWRVTARIPFTGPETI